MMLGTMTPEEKEWGQIVDKLWDEAQCFLAGAMYHLSKSTHFDMSDLPDLLEDVLQIEDYGC